MTSLTRLFESIRAALGGSSPEPDFAAITDRADWPVNTTRGRWVDYRNERTDR